MVNTSALSKSESTNLDLRAEIFFAMLSLNGSVKKTPVFFPRSAFKRKFRKDVSGVSTPGNYEFKINRLVIETNRNGLYDLFPEYLFHKNKRTKNFKTVGELKEESKFNNEIEQNTRIFFWPLDDCIVKMKHMVASLEEIDRLGAQGNSVKILNKFWRIPSFFSKSQTQLLMTIMPMVKDISANPLWISKTFSKVLNEAVSISESWTERAYRTENFKGLNDAELGVSTICGSSYKSIIRVFRIQIGPISNSPLYSYISSGVNKKRLDFLIGYFIPADTEIEFNLVPRSAESFILSSKPTDQNVLGVSTYLN